MKKTLIFISILLLSLIVPTICIVKKIHFDQDCAGYLKQAADASTVELAIDKLNKAIEYIEAHNLTTGYTSVLWRTEDENMEYWYSNIKACKSELEKCVDSTQLEQSNILLKVREALTDSGHNGNTELTIPTGVSRYPHNLLFGILRWISLLLFLFDLIGIAFFLDVEKD